MKKIYFNLIVFLFTFSIARAQWTPTGTTIVSTNYNVGIGTTSPSAKLEVFGTLVTGGDQANLDRALYPNFNYLTNTGKMLIGWNRSGGDGETLFLSNRGGGGLGGFVFSDLNNNGTETPLMYLCGNGNVSIGTKDSKGYKLAVNGKIRSQEIKVEIDNWPDYVFRKDYILPSLTEVKSYIDQNQHLPDLPSEKEVATNGINLGEMNKLLTKKIEELTLYLIEQNRQMQLQQKINNDLLERVQKIEKQQKL